MMYKNKLLNKYTLSVIIVFLVVLTDVLLHKGLTRALIPDSFTSQRQPVQTSTCETYLDTDDKHWMKGINTVSAIQELPTNTAGFEMDVYFDTTKNYLEVYHDSSNISELNIEQILSVYAAKKMNAGIWLDFKNLSQENLEPALKYIIYLRKKYNLNNKLIIESTKAYCLPAFCNKGFFTSYYTPYFNPYEIDEKSLVEFIDTIQINLSKYKVSALSGYYFQYPLLKRYFPSYPILTWVDKTQASLVANRFKKVLSKDNRVKIVLAPAH